MELYFNGRNLLIIVGYYLIINLILYFTMVIDKKRAIKDGGFPKRTFSFWLFWAAASAV